MAMTLREIMALAPLALCILVLLISCAGLLVGDVYDRLHCAGPASVLAPWLLLAAVTIRFSFTEAVIKMVLLALALALCGPILTHATARMVHRLRHEKDIPETASGHS
jgi:multicomponent Na+:H+ antiporter subunit G